MQRKTGPQAKGPASPSCPETPAGERLRRRRRCLVGSGLSWARSRVLRMCASEGVCACSRDGPVGSAERQLRSRAPSFPGAAGGGRTVPASQGRGLSGNHFSHLQPSSSSRNTRLSALRAVALRWQELTSEPADCSPASVLGQLVVAPPQCPLPPPPRRARGLCPRRFHLSTAAIVVSWHWPAGLYPFSCAPNPDSAATLPSPGWPRSPQHTQICPCPSVSNPPRLLSVTLCLSPHPHDAQCVLGFSGRLCSALAPRLLPPGPACSKLASCLLFA